MMRISWDTGSFERICLPEQTIKASGISVMLHQRRQMVDRFISKTSSEIKGKLDKQ